jgi:hypothetical protein
MAQVTQDIMCGWLVDDKYIPVDHIELIRTAREAYLPTGHWDKKVGKIMWPGGPSPARIWLLLRKLDLDQLDLNGFHKIDFSCGYNKVECRNMIISKEPINVTPSGAISPGLVDNSVYMVEFADMRWLAMNPYFANPATNRHYNVLAPDAGFTKYYTDSLTVTGDTYTWQGVLDDLWDALNVSELSQSPLLPFTPHSYPENLRFIGVPAWAAYNEVLRRLSCMFVLKPDSTTLIVQQGVTDDAWTAIETKYKNDVMYDGEYKQIIRGKVPSKVRVIFHKFAKHYGSEQTTNATTYQWTTKQIYTVDILESEVATDVTDKVQPGSTAYIWDDMRAEVDFNDNVINTQNLFNRARERATDYYRTVFTGGDRMYRSYTGVIAEDGVYPGSQVAAVAWVDDNYLGPRTEVVRYPLMVRVIEEEARWDEIYDQDIHDHFKHPDISRPTFPNYPIHEQLVRLVSSVPDAETGLYDAYVRRYDPDTNLWYDAEQCWVVDPNA